MVEPGTKVGGDGWRRTSLEGACWKPHHPALDGKHLSEELWNRWPRAGSVFINKVLLKLWNIATPIYGSIIYGGPEVVTKTIWLTKPSISTSGSLQRMVQTEGARRWCSISAPQSFIPNLHTGVIHPHAKPHPASFFFFLFFFQIPYLILVPFTGTTVFKCYYYIFISLGFSLKAMHHVNYSHCSLAGGLWDHFRGRCFQVFPRAMWLPVLIVNGLLTLEPQTNTMRDHFAQRLALMFCIKLPLNSNKASAN